jgi:hypothetical protein
MTFHALLSINQIDKTKINRQDLWTTLSQRS